MACVVVVLAFAAPGVANAALAPATVGSAQIRDHSIQPVDLSTDVIHGSRCRWGPESGHNYTFRSAFDPELNSGVAPSLVVCLVPDRFEPNDTPRTAADILGVLSISASIYPRGEDDWYRTPGNFRYVDVCPLTYLFHPAVVTFGPRPAIAEVIKGTESFPLVPQVNDFCARYDNGVAEDRLWKVHITGNPAGYELSFYTS